MAGLDATGLTIATFEEIDADIKSAVLSDVSSTLDLGSTSLLGNMIAIFAERLALLWELLEMVYSSQDPDAATGDALRQLGALTGTVEEPPRPSTTTLTLTGTPATLVAAGSVAGTAAGVEFATDEDATIASLTAWAGATAYLLNDRRRNASRCYIVTVAGTSAGSGGPTTTDSAIVDGTVTWRYLGEGTGAVDVDATATEDGPQAALSGTVVEIVTPVSGWSSVINLTDAVEGRGEETDEEFRQRREEDLANAGTSPVDAIRSRILEVEGVTACTVFHNTTDDLDAENRPPHSVEAIVTGGDDQDVLEALHAAVAGGIATYGQDVIGNVTDSAGNVLEYQFTRPNEIEIYVAITVEYDERFYPDDGDDEIALEIIELNEELRSGYNVRASAVSAKAHGVPGLLGVTVCNIGTAPAPGSSATISIGVREVGVFDTSRITVTSSAVTP